MAEDLKVCDVDPDLKNKLKEFRLSKSKMTRAIIMKVDKDSQTVVLEESYDEIDIDELQDELPTSQPRYVALSYELKHDDGRISYPLCFIFVSPAGCKPEQQMMYAGSLKALVTDLSFTKVFEIRSLEDFTEEWLVEKLKFFR